MIGTKRLGQTMAVLLLNAVSALAQPVEDQGTPAAANAGQQSQSTDENSGADSSDDSGREPLRPERSPTDYRASEQISEDLPVSFPVDI